MPVGKADERLCGEANPLNSPDHLHNIENVYLLCYFFIQNNLIMFFNELMMILSCRPRWQKYYFMWILRRARVYFYAKSIPFTKKIPNCDHVVLIYWKHFILYHVVTHWYLVVVGYSWFKKENYTYKKFFLKNLKITCYFFWHSLE